MKKILIIEDDLTLQESISDIIEQEGYQVTRADNGKKGLDLLSKNEFDVVLCDIMMPGVDGFRVLKVLKNYLKGIPPVFIFITAKSERSEWRKGMELGADDYLTKPFSREELINAVDSRMKKRSIINEKVDFKNEVLDILKNKLKTVVPDTKTKKEPGALSFDGNLFLSNYNKSDFIKVNSVVYISASGDYSKIYTKDKKSYLVRKPMKNWESKLPSEHFIRINRSLIIGTEYIEKVEKWKTYSNKVFLQGITEPFVISQRYNRKLRQQMKKL